MVSTSSSHKFFIGLERSFVLVPVVCFSPSFFQNHIFPLLSLIGNNITNKQGMPIHFANQIQICIGMKKNKYQGKRVDVPRRWRIRSFFFNQRYPLIPLSFARFMSSSRVKFSNESAIMPPVKSEIC